MKKIVFILLAMALVVQSTSQLWILVSFYINRQYIASNLCINRFDTIPVCKGSCYLEKQLSENEQQQQKIPEVKNKEVVLFCQSITAHCITPADNASVTTYPAYNPGSFPCSCYTAVFRPPAVIG